MIDVRKILDDARELLEHIPRGFYAVPIEDDGQLVGFGLYERTTPKKAHLIWNVFTGWKSADSWPAYCRTAEWNAYLDHRKEVEEAGRRAERELIQEWNRVCPFGQPNRASHPLMQEHERLHQENFQRKRLEELERVRYVLDHLDECREKYGQLTGYCGCCHRQLSDQVSVIRGIGPECLKKHRVTDQLNSSRRL